MPRIEAITIERTTPEIKKVLEELHEYYGNIPMIYRVVVRRPQIAKSLLQLKKAVMENGRLERKLKEKVAVIVSLINKSNACAEANIENLRKLGASEDEITALRNLDFTNSEEEESVALEFAQKSTSGPVEIPTELFTKMKEIYNDTEIVELLSVVGLYKFLSTVNTALELPTY